jgi:hypothetical protein
MTTNSGPWRIELYADDAGRSPYQACIEDVDDASFSALEAAVEHVLTRHGIDLCKTEWMKPLGQGLYEFRVRHDAQEIRARFGQRPQDSAAREKILLRVFCHFYGDKVVLLLTGYDKGADPSPKRQQKEIAQARKHLTAWTEQQKRDRARAKRGR